MSRPLFYQQTDLTMTDQKSGRKNTELSFCCPLPPKIFYVKMLLSKLENEIFSLYQT
jgi:hypothetical protein